MFKKNVENGTINGTIIVSIFRMRLGIKNGGLYKIFQRYSYSQLQELFKKSQTKEEQEFYMSLSNILLQKQQSKICKMGSITPAELKEIKELDRLEWQEDVVEDITEYIIEEKIKEEKIRLAKNLLDVLDNETIAEKTGLDIDLIEALRI